MSDNTPEEPIESITDSATIEPVPDLPTPVASDAVAFDGAAPAPAYNPLASAEAAYDPQPLAGQEDTSRNWMGIVALITAIVGFGIAAIVFAILGLNAVKQRKANNKGMSIAALIVTAAYWLIGIALIVVLAIFASKHIDDARAQVGDCFESSVTVGSTDLQAVDPDFGTCTSETDAEVYYVGSYTGTAQPSDAGFGDEISGVCLTDAALANVDVDVASAYNVEYYLPGYYTWAVSDHTVVCSVSTGGGPVDEAAVAE